MVRPNTNAIGETTVSLNENDKAALARACDVCLQIGYFGSDAQPADQPPPSASQIALGLRAILADHADPAANQNDAATDEAE